MFEEKKVLEFMMKNTGNIEYIKTDIEKPKNIIQYQDVL
jgi:hypothetical protein